MNVIATELPPHSALHERIRERDFIDCYRVASALSPRQAAEIITSFPSWAGLLLAIRNGITKPFGLLSEGPSSDNSVGIFPVELERDRELIAGFNDKHLDFRVTVMSDQGYIYLATWVHTHNLAGALYLKTILPFHILIVRDALNRVRLKG